MNWIRLLPWRTVASGLAVTRPKTREAQLCAGCEKMWAKSALTPVSCTHSAVKGGGEGDIESLMFCLKCLRGMEISDG